MSTCIDHPYAGHDENGCMACWWRREAGISTDIEFERTRQRGPRITHDGRRIGKWADMLATLAESGKGATNFIRIDAPMTQKKVMCKRIRNAAPMHGIRASVIISKDGISVMNVGKYEHKEKEVPFAGVSSSLIPG